MMNRQLSEFIEIINDTEDILNGGWRSSHPEIRIPEMHPSGKLSAAPAAKAVSSADGAAGLEEIAQQIHACTACGLHSGRNIAVPGAGVIKPAVMFIGEGPGAEEDRTGIPFVGKAGQYLDKWLAAIDLNRAENCFIGNIIKCRPPNNRDPHPDEISACRPFLMRQLQLIRPDIIITLGRFASQVICNSEEGIGRLRGRTHYYEGVPVVPTYHPSAVLRNPELRKAVWDDLKRAKELLDEIERNR